MNKEEFTGPSPRHYHIEKCQAKHELSPELLRGAPERHINRMVEDTKDMMLRSLIEVIDLKGAVEFHEDTDAESGKMIITANLDVVIYD